MTHDEPHESKQDLGPAGKGPPGKGLPFEYEDRSDGRHARALEELRAAWLWTQSRRARGLLPS